MVRRFAFDPGAHRVKLCLLRRADVDGEDDGAGRTLRELGDTKICPTPADRIGWLSMATV